jgi:hypothetical protein
VPTNRKRQRRGWQVGLNYGQRSLLLTGHDFFALPGEPLFASEEEERAAWQRYRVELLASNDFNTTTCAGMRPPAVWLYDYGLRRVVWPREFDWPRGIASEAHMIHRELKAGRLAPNVPDEIAQIEAAWRKAIENSAACGAQVAVDGVPRWFTHKHLPKAIAEHERAAAQFRATLMGQRMGKGAVAK